MSERYYVQSEQSRKEKRIYWVMDKQKDARYGRDVEGTDTFSQRTAELRCWKLNNGLDWRERLSHRAKQLLERKTGGPEPGAENGGWRRFCLHLPEDLA